MAPFVSSIVSIFSLLALFVAFPCQAGFSPPPSSGFVQTRNAEFVLNGSLFFFNGFNSDWVTNTAAVPSHRSQVSDFFAQAAAAGLSVCRTRAFGDGASHRHRALQISSGAFSDHIFQGLDFVISESRKHKVRLIVSLRNSYSDFGGGRRLGTNAGDGLFYTNEVIKGYFKKKVETLLTRINTITGVAYMDDPTIMAWELLNEPRSQVDHFEKPIDEWIKEMAGFVKSIDSNHLLTVGVKGLFYGDKNMLQKMAMDPAGYQIGIDFVSSHLSKEIDFTIIQANPYIWLKAVKDDNGRMYGGKENYKQYFSNMHKLQRRILHNASPSPSQMPVNVSEIAVVPPSSLPFPSPSPVNASEIAAAVPPSEASGCTHIPDKNGHCCTNCLK